MSTGILDQFRELLERDRKRRQTVLDGLQFSLSSICESEVTKRRAFEAAILAGQQMLQAAEARLRSLDEAVVRATDL